MVLILALLLFASLHTLPNYEQKIERNVIKLEKYQRP